MPDDNIPSQKYRDTGIRRYFVTSSIVDNFCKNSTVRIVCSAFADSLSHNCVLSPVHISNNVEATLSKQQATLLLRQRCRFGQQCRNNVRLCRKDEILTQNSFDIVAFFGNKVERCFDIVAGVDRALMICKLSASGRGCHVAGIYVRVFMYVDDLLLISSTCSDLRVAVIIWRFCLFAMY